MALDFTETLLLELPDVERQLGQFAEGDFGENHGLIVEIAGIHAGLTANYNLYSEAELEAAVNSWTTPYPKPIILHHDPTSEAIGRVINAKMDQEPDGTKFIRLQAAITDPQAIQKIRDKRYLTGSVGGRAQEATCSVCGKDWSEASMFNAPCKHVRGKTYQGKLAALELKNISFKEYCTDPDTEIMTQEGWKTVFDLRVGDFALAINPETGMSGWEPIQNIYIGPHVSRPMLKMEGVNHDSLTTLSHRWLTQSQKLSKSGKFRWRTSETLSRQDWIPTAVPHADYSKSAKYSDAFVELVGWFWAEGSFYPSGGGEISQSHIVNPANIAQIRSALLSEFGADGPMVRGPGKNEFHWNENVRPNDVTIFRLSAEIVRGTFRSVLGNEKEILPHFLMELTKSQLHLLLSAMLAGDGTKSEAGQRVVTQVSELRIRSLEMVCAMLGIPTSTTITPEGFFSLCLLKQAKVNPYNAAYMLEYDKKKNPTRKRLGRTAVEVVDYDGIVWCPTLPSGNWLARRNGQVYYTGNSFVNMPADQLSSVRALGESADSGGMKLFSLDMNKEEIIEFTESEDINVLSGLKKKESAPLYLGLKGAFLSALAIAESENNTEEKLMIDEDTPQEDEDVLAVAERLSANLAAAQTAEEDTTTEDAEDAEEAEKAEGQEKVHDKDVDPETSEGADKTRESEEEGEATADVVAETETEETEEEQEDDETAKTITELNEAKETLESHVAELLAQMSSLQEENAKLKAALKRGLAERVVDTKIALGLLEAEARETELEAHVSRTAASLADSLRDLAAMPKSRPTTATVPTMKVESAAVVEKDDHSPIDGADETEDSAANDNDPEAFFTDVFMGRKQVI